ncbi:hypothetical protein B5X24_HaOG216979 [Helicoverpa armigera]|uniref:Uncharacterized protein n=1 Tax=Helicoverpa armigera TaxID=29058 RepID=A0A2W1BVE5_HELAM|nr:hypothetical protein B5X24_HaOG216979 [Helicoverpa armigera]
MPKRRENLDFSGLFKLDVLLHLDITTYSFYEVGHKKFFAFTSDKELIFIYIDPQSERFEYNYDWDFLDNPIYCMCFEPSGTWVIIVSEQKVLLVPFLPLFSPQNAFDQKWSLSRVTVLPLGVITKPTSLVCWLTKESESVLIIGSKTGSIAFYSLDTQSIVGECKVPGEITDLQICFDDSLDLLTLLISISQSQQCKLVLEHRSYGYNWLQQTRAQNDRDKKDSFMSYIKQLSKDKITFFIQGGSKDEGKSQTVEYVLKPTEYLPLFRKGSNNWALTAQYVNGRHFLTAFELNEGTLILESPEEDTPTRTLRPHIRKDGLYVQGLWSQRLIYLLRKKEVEVHSSSFSVIEGRFETLVGSKSKSSELWRAELIGDVRRGHLMSSREPPAMPGGWREPTFMCDLQLPRFSLESCLIVTNKGAYILNTVSDACEWVVGGVMRGSCGADTCAALGAALPALLRAAADMLLARGKLPLADYLYSMSQRFANSDEFQLDGWVTRLGVFGRLNEMSSYKKSGNIGDVSTTLQMLATLVNISNGTLDKFNMESDLITLKPVELLELCSFSAAVGLWELAPVFSIHSGHPSLLLSALKSRKDLCRGAIHCLLEQSCIVPLLLEENGQWLFDYIIENCSKFDTDILKCLCLWLNPMQDLLRPVMRDLKQGITSIYTTRLQLLISTFTQIACVIDSREPCPEIHLQLKLCPDTWKNQFTPKRALSCGLSHWAVVDEGNAKVMMTNTPINPKVIGRVVDVACGRHHTLVLTENGIYAAGDNSFGQLGVGLSWRGGVGDDARPAGALLPVCLPHQASAPIAIIAAGHYHSAAVDVGGRLYTWGWGVHGQLCHGSIDDEFSPKLVTKFQGRKVLSIGCGACHSVVLTQNGEVWASGAGVFGQLGSASRQKASIPRRVVLPEPVRAIAVGYFHNLALTNSGAVYVWGASPQQVRAADARRLAESAGESAARRPAELPARSPDEPPARGPVVPPARGPADPVSSPPAPDPHLVPQRLNTCNVTGDIVQLAAGWHHSCLLNNAGTLYSWGLNFDGQLGSGDRKQITIPTEVKMATDAQPDIVKNNNAKTPEADKKDFKTRALVACGGDFTVYIDNDGRIYATGNIHQQLNNEKDKGGNRVIMMKTTKRVIKIPASRNNKFLFQPVDRIDIMFPFDLEAQRKPIEGRLNPLTSIQDFSNKSWADDIILILKPWLNEENFKGNCNMAAKFAYHNKMYSECLRLLLNNLKYEVQGDQTYVTHTSKDDENPSSEEGDSSKKEELNLIIKNIMSKRIKDVSMASLNSEPYPPVDPATYKALPCCCDELKYCKTGESIKSTIDEMECDISLKAAQIIDQCMSIFPVNTELWELCFRLSKNFFLENNLSIPKLEIVLRKYMETDSATMAAAIMYSNDCAQYSKIFSPKFYLNMCSNVLDTWG